MSRIKRPYISSMKSLACFATKSPHLKAQMTSVIQYLSKQKQTQVYSIGDGKIVKVQTRRSINSQVDEIISYFLPKGYPQSVDNGYGNFVKFQMIAAIFGTSAGVLSMQSLLFAVGIGSSEALPLAATLNWIIKDGLGQFGGVLFASLVSNRFDTDPKRWRLLSTVAMDTASLLEILTPLFPGYFLPIASIANVGKNISFLSASASRAAIHRSFAIHENLADVTAKTGSQTVLCGTVGSFLGISLAASIGSDYAYTVAAFLCCSTVNITATYFSLREVRLKPVSLDRLDLLMDGYFNSRQSDKSRKIITPEEMTALERHLAVPTLTLPKYSIGENLDTVFQSSQEMQECVNLFKNDQYIITCRSSSSSSSGHNMPGSPMVNNCSLPSSSSQSSESAAVHLLLKQNCTLNELLRGIIHVYFVRVQLMHDEGQHEQNHSLSEGSRTCFQRLDVVHRAGQIMKMAAPLSMDEIGIDRLPQISANECSLNSTEGSQSSADCFLRALEESSWIVDELLLETRHARIL